eukprot:scaffold9589_cov173-Skeletonema_marinoi.AAC.1
MEFHNFNFFKLQPVNDCGFIGLTANSIPIPAPAVRRYHKHIMVSSSSPKSSTAMPKDKVYNQTATPDETPILIKDKLAEFELALDDVGDEEKRCYLMAKEKGPD